MALDVGVEVVVAFKMVVALEWVMGLEVVVGVGWTPSQANLQNTRIEITALPRKRQAEGRDARRRWRRNEGITAIVTLNILELELDSK